MSKILRKNKDIFKWLSWLFLVVIWNYGYPEAEPLFDVLVAIFLSIFFILIKKR
jgi:hypothetical protein|tara:strand:- start:1747 stop:1908 length:162 start_codon:yes stop_codon:yes gene_type:complete